MTINLESLVQNIVNTLTTETVVGEPVHIGDVTLIPVMNASFGFGGGGENKASAANAGSGGGGGARLTAAGFVVVKDGEVTFIPTGRGARRGSAVDKILDSLPELIEKFKPAADKAEEEGNSDGDA